MKNHYFRNSIFRLALKAIIFSLVIACAKDEPAQCDYELEQGRFAELESRYFQSPTTENCEALRTAARNFSDVLKGCGKVLNGPEYWSEDIESYVTDKCSEGKYYVSSYATFWIRQNMNCGNINVTLNGQTKTIDGVYYYPEGVLQSYGCNLQGSANFETHTGTYAYTATCSGKSWNGIVTLRQNDCSQIELKSNSTGTTTKNGKATFWVNQDLGCGAITVTINSQTATITSYYSSTPNCGVSGSANFDLPPGTYNYSARCNGLSWSGSVTIKEDGCLLMQLTR